MNKIALLLIIMFLYLETNSCSCIELGEINLQEISEYEFIARGIIISDPYFIHSYKETYDFKILELFKGQIKDSILQISTNPDGASCGYGMSKDEMHLIFADSTNGILETSTCSRSSVIREMPDTTMIIAPKGYWKNEFNNSVNKDLTFLRTSK